MSVAVTQSARIGRFEILETISENPFAIVYRGRDGSTGEEVAVKLCIAGDDAIRRRFLAAAETAAALHHPNIARLLGFGSADSKPYLVREYLTGPSLSRLLRSEPPVDDILKLFYLVQVAGAVRYAHQQGVLHRDLRPGVVGLMADEQVKVVDFGTSWLRGAAVRLAGDGAAAEVVGYPAPEQIVGLEADVRGDVFGFGALAYELLTARSPFPGNTVGELLDSIVAGGVTPIEDLWPDCPPELSVIVGRCLHRDPLRRYPSFDALVADLSAVVPVPGVSDRDPWAEEVGSGLELDTVYLLDPPRAEGTAPAVVEAPVAEQTGGTGRWAALAAIARRLADRFGPAAVRLGRRLIAGWRELDARWPVAARVVLPAGAALALLLLAVWAFSPRATPGPDPVAATATVPAAATVPTAPSQAATLIVDAAPWGELVGLADASGATLQLPANRFTPLRLTLPAGEYRLELLHPGVEEPQPCRVRVPAVGSARCRVEFPPSRVTDYFKEAGWWR